MKNKVLSDYERAIELCKFLEEEKRKEDDRLGRLLAWRLQLWKALQEDELVQVDAKPTYEHV